jgi:hypothetical protein
MEEKIKRFIELSKEFTVKSNNIYGDSIATYPSTSSVYVDFTHESQLQPTKLEQFTKAQRDKVEKAERYEEYLTLQTDLSNFYNALTKLK